MDRDNVFLGGNHSPTSLYSVQPNQTVWFVSVLCSAAPRAVDPSLSREIGWKGGKCSGRNEEH